MIKNDQTALLILLPNIFPNISDISHLKNPQNISKLCAFLFLLFLSLSGLGGTFPRISGAEKETHLWGPNPRKRGQTSTVRWQHPNHSKFIKSKKLSKIWYQKWDHRQSIVSLSVCHKTQLLELYVSWRLIENLFSAASEKCQRHGQKDPAPNCWSGIVQSWILLSSF